MIGRNPYTKFNSTYRACWKCGQRVKHMRIGIPTYQWWYRWRKQVLVPLTHLAFKGKHWEECRGSKTPK